VVIDDLNIERVSLLPPEAHAPLLVNADTVLALTVTSQRFKLIEGGIMRSRRSKALSKYFNFSRARCWISRLSVRTNSPLKIASVFSQGSSSLENLAEAGAQAIDNQIISAAIRLKRCITSAALCSSDAFARSASSRNQTSTSFSNRSLALLRSARSSIATIR
jgi:hypothetical protein